MKPQLPPLEQLFEEAFAKAIELDRPDLVARLVEAVAVIVGPPTLGGRS